MFPILSRIRPWAAAASLLLILPTGLAMANSGAEDASWFDLPDVDEISSGELRFLAEPPEKAVHHHRNRLIVNRASLTDGWATLEQCHRHLDPVPLAEVVYRADRVSDLAITEAEGIGHAAVDGASVQLRDVGPDARLCVRARSRVVHRLDDGGYAIRNGPFMRRFLDGYFPMRVSLRVEFPVDELQVTGISPAAQPGVRVDHQPGAVDIDAWFEGRLLTEVRIRPR